MPGYVEKQLLKYNHPKPTKPQHCPWEPNPKKFGTSTKAPLPEDKSPPMDDTRKKYIQ